MPFPSPDESIFRSLFDAYPDALLVVDADGVIILANPAALQLLGYGDEIVGISVDALVPDAIRPRHAGYRSAYGQAPRSRPMGMQMDLVARRKDGSEVMVEIALSPLHGKGLPYVVAAIRGIGAYPRVRAALQRARYSERLTIYGRFAVDTRDPSRLIEEAPRVAVDALEIPAAMVYLLETDRLRFRVASGVGLLPQQPLGSFVPNTEDTLMGHVMATGKPLVANGGDAQGVRIAPYYRQAGLENAAAVPLSDLGQVIGVLVVRSRASQPLGTIELQFVESLGSLLTTGLQRARSDEALLHTQRLESVGQLTGGIAHDFNNLLTVISGNLQIIQSAPAIMQDQGLSQMVQAAGRAAGRAADLTGKLLAFSRRQVLQPASIDPAEMLHSVTEMLRRTLDQRIHVEIDVSSNCPRCIADRSQLESSLLNVAINARDAMAQGGVLRFSAQAVDELPSRARSGHRDPGSTGYVAISVSDTGTGMPDAVKERAFEPFFTTKEAGRGTGLGLSSVYGFATQSKGAVSLESSVGSGTTITLYLPRPRHSMRAEEPGRRQIEVPRGLHVLLVEDDVEVLAVVENFVHNLGGKPTCCRTAEQAIATLSRSANSLFDVVLSDVALGAGMRGTTLANEIASRWPKLPVILMSGYSSELLASETTLPLLRKPFGQRELADRISEVLTSREDAD